MVDPTFPAFPIVSMLGFILALIPLPWHLQAWNSGTCYYMFWTSLACLNEFINSVVWAHSIRDVAPWFCDISTRIILGASVGIPMASLCITRRLYNISRVNNVMITRAEKRRMVLHDSLLCLLFPIIYIAISYVVQGHRYNIFENIGCYPAIYNTLPTYFLVYMWPLIIALTSSVYCCLSLFALIKRQAQFREFLQSGSTSLTVSRYYRLMALAMCEIVFTVPLSIYELYSNAVGGALNPWLGWADTHFDFSQVSRYPAIIWRTEPLLVIPFELTRWTMPLCAFAFFLFFGFAAEARRHYHMAWKFICDRFAIFRFTTAIRLSSKQSSTRKRLPDEALPAYDYPKPPAPLKLYGADTSMGAMSLGDYDFDVEKAKTAVIPRFPTTPTTPSSGSEFSSAPNTPSSADSLVDHRASIVSLYARAPTAMSILTVD